MRMRNLESSLIKVLQNFVKLRFLTIFEPYINSVYLNSLKCLIKYKLKVLHIQSLLFCTWFPYK